MNFLNVLVHGKSKWFREAEDKHGEKMIVPKSREIAFQGDETVKYNRRVEAVHEAGHAAMMHILGMDDFAVIMAGGNSRIVRTGKCLRYANAEDIRKLILVKYASAAAEELIFGFFHSGCMGSETSDFNSAAELLKECIVMTDPNASKTMLDCELSERMIALSKELYQEAKDILKENQKMIEIIADKLMTKNQLSRAEIEELLKEEKEKKKKVTNFRPGKPTM